MAYVPAAGSVPSATEQVTPGLKGPNTCDETEPPEAGSVRLRLVACPLQVTMKGDEAPVQPVRSPFTVLVK